MDFKKVVFILFFPVFLFSYCQPSTTETPQVVEQITTTQPGFIHTVYFWMKADLSQENRTAFEKGMEKLATVPSIQTVYWGPPAATDRDVIDSSYDYAWITHFANEADHDKYQEDQIHLDFIEASKDWWEKVQVYDNVVEHSK